MGVDAGSKQGAQRVLLDPTTGSSTMRAGPRCQKNVSRSTDAERPTVKQRLARVATTALARIDDVGRRAHLSADCGADDTRSRRRSQI